MSSKYYSAQHAYITDTQDIFTPWKPVRSEPWSSFVEWSASIIFCQYCVRPHIYWLYYRGQGEGSLPMQLPMEKPRNRLMGIQPSSLLIYQEVVRSDVYAKQKPGSNKGLIKHPDCEDLIVICWSKLVSSLVLSSQQTVIHSSLKHTLIIKTVCYWEENTGN